MTIFGKHYATYYDLLYRDKDYAAEAAYLNQLIQAHRPHARSILELGSGTGKHAALLAEMGYAVDGVDRSSEMLASAKEQSAHVRFFQGDLRSVQMDRKYDAVIAMFHVMSYMTDNADLIRTFKNASRHLHQGGVFMFDCWYGPAVLTDRPSVRIKRLGDEQREVIRLTEPTLHANENTVDVEYQIIVRDKLSAATSEFREKHRLRYLFEPEVKLLYSLAGMSLERCTQFMTGNSPGDHTWNVLFVGRKR